MRDKLNVMPFPAGEMRYRMGWNGKGRYIKCFCQQFSFLIEKRIKTKGLQVEGEDTGVHGRDGMSACEGGGEGGGVGGGGEKQRCWWGGREWWLGVFVIKKTKTKKTKEKQTDWSQPRMRLDLPPGGFLRPPEAALAPPDGSEGCGTSFCCWSCSSCWSCTSSGYSTAKKKRGDNVLLCRPQQWVMWLLFCSAVFPDVAVWSGPQAHSGSPEQNMDYCQQS